MPQTCSWPPWCIVANMLTTTSARTSSAVLKWCLHLGRAQLKQARFQVGTALRRLCITISFTKPHSSSRQHCKLTCIDTKLMITYTN